MTCKYSGFADLTSEQFLQLSCVFFFSYFVFVLFLSTVTVISYIKERAESIDENYEWKVMGGKTNGTLDIPPT